MAIVVSMNVLVFPLNILNATDTCSNDESKVKFNIFLM